MSRISFDYEGAKKTIQNQDFIGDAREVRTPDLQIGHLVLLADMATPYPTYAP